MIKHILITGGAGFIGSHLADELLEQGYTVRVLDTLSEQVHGKEKKRPDYLNPEVELQIGDVRNANDIRIALEGIDAVFHIAALVGVGQSMYEIREYTDVNNVGTATLLQALIDHPVKKLIVASSMSIYGEGLYEDIDGNLKEHCERKLSDLKSDKWEMIEKENYLKPIPTPETKTPKLSSVYALSKYDQERLSLITGKAYNIPTTALRFFNVYGTRQALSNPYTGVLAIFASRLLNDKPPIIFEDGYQKRDFIHVKDVVRACRMAMEAEQSNGEVYNVGSGNQYTITSIAQKLAEVMNKDIQPEVNGKYRVGDIRHCFADTTKIKNELGFEPQVNFEDGLYELAEWLKDQIATDKVNQASTELESRGLTV
ncbi:SDR family NAD(P)-dependent oxidoreductase [Leeuwenhoekiella aequorea]|uniref:SDR family NAD(P)-dependent oxidoreductase n=1 Tax=Leeuwenhoekiella aequorea TaxID=283736 RepID=UPI00352E9E15